MGLKDLQLENMYETTASDTYLLDEFYLPTLEKTKKYYRIAGYFNSSALIVAAKGIEALIHNDGKMYLLVSPELTKEDYQIIKQYNSLPEECKIFSDLELKGMIDDNLKALAWMLANDRLEIKIVIGNNSVERLFHQKIGIMMDDSNDMISFSGSINETARGWLHNIEEFKVFRSWISGQDEYLFADLKKFLSYWKNQRQDIAQVYDIPKAIKEQIISIKPKDIYDLHIMRKYRNEKEVENNSISLFPHQQQAVDLWIKNRYSLLMEMATGTGKTRTAIGCVSEKLKDKNENLLVIIATPQNTLSLQWAREISNLGVKIEKSRVIDGTNTKWKKELEFLLLDLAENSIKNAIIYTTHATACTSNFLKIIEKNKFDSKILFICDEVHAAGSKEQQKALHKLYDYRIGLSATPNRMFDENGSALIKHYFGELSYEFTIEDALNSINPLTGKAFLNSYCYYPIFVEMNDEEKQKYKDITRKIQIMKNQKEYDEEDLQRLYDKRANIIKNAENKYVCFDELLEKMEPEKINDTLVFTSPQQLEKCFKTITSKGIKVAKITEKESASKIVNNIGETERQNYISFFIKRELQILVGIKCLDEGIDIPTAHTAILMSSSINPREYVQRIGRVIRQAEGKPVSSIYDIIVVNLDNSSVIEKEAVRAHYIARNALNYQLVKEQFLEYGVDFDAYQ